MTPIAQQKIRKAFSKAADRYDELATLQQTVGLRFLKSLQVAPPKTALDIGMGTGWFTDNLARQFPKAKVTGIDFASGMVECARERKSRFNVIQAEAADLPFSDGCFDMITSNLSYQWLDNLAAAFREVNRTLKVGGTFYFSAFAKNSLTELIASIEKCENGRSKEFLPKALPSKEDYTNALMKAGFQNIHVLSENFKVHFASAMALVRWLKNIGANAGGGKSFWGKNRLLRIDEIYSEHFSENDKIVASFEVVWAKAKK